MAPALDAHHALIRRLIAKHQCYEVKTIGDSFMCAAHTPQQAVRLALAIQTALHRHDWGTAALSAAYAEGPNPGAAACWNGLRVRVGIHHGLGSVRFDPVAKGYDYYGTVVNVASRIEGVSHGGQVVVSEDVYDAVCFDVPDVKWTDLGVHALRGLPEPLHLFQALPVGLLACRTFPPLRLNTPERRWEEREGEEGEAGVVVVSPHTLSPAGAPLPATAAASSSGPSS
eukprot:EG_transcript_28243